MLWHIRFNPETYILSLLDQRRLPKKIKYLHSDNYREIVLAIKNMTIRGAPLIGVAAAYACVLAAREGNENGYPLPWLLEAFDEIEKARPTAVNLSWAVNQMRCLAQNQDSISSEILLAAATKLHQKDIEICRKLGIAGADLIRNGDTVLTHCNAGALATGGFGTALGIIRAAKEEGKNIKVIADETRPLLQGARLTAWELAQDGIPVKIACDNACAMLMKKKQVNLVITGADRVAMNGDTANKIGTFGIAIIAHYFKIPFYIACPISTIDSSCKNGKSIPIEERDESEVLQLNGNMIAPENIGAFNYAFDVTPASLITAIVTEEGIVYPPYEINLPRILERNASA